MIRPIRIFLAEDNPGDVTLVRVALEVNKVKYTMRVAHLNKDVESLMAAMGEDEDHPHPDCLVLDMHLPDISGLEILAKFREKRETANVPAIVISSSKSPSDRLRAEQAGVEHYFPKPLHLKEYLRLGELILQVSQPATA